MDFLSPNRVLNRQLSRERLATALPLVLALAAAGPAFAQAAPDPSMAPSAGDAFGASDNGRPALSTPAPTPALEVTDVNKPLGDNEAAFTADQLDYDTQAHIVTASGDVPQSEMDAGGKLLLPGFNDAHVHFISGGLTPSRSDSVGCCGKSHRHKPWCSRAVPILKS